MPKQSNRKMTFAKFFAVFAALAKQFHLTKQGHIRSRSARLCPICAVAKWLRIDCRITNTAWHMVARVLGLPDQIANRIMYAADNCCHGREQAGKIRSRFLVAMWS